MPIQLDPIGFVTLPGAVPFNACSPASPTLVCLKESMSPFQPPTSTSPMITIGSSAAMITKNCSTSL